MTDEALGASVDTGAMPSTAPVADVAQPAIDTGTQQPGTEQEGKDTAPAKPKLEASPRSAIERAMAKLNGEQERDPATGQFKGKDTPQAPKDNQPPPKTPTQQQTAQPKPGEQQQTQQPKQPGQESGDAPARFKSAAAAMQEWAKTPAPVQAAIHRTVRELEKGIEQHRADAQAFNDVRAFDELAKKSGTTMQAAMSNYVGIEMMLRQDPIAGLNQIANNMGFSLREVAAHIMGQQPDQVQSQNDATIRELRQEIASLKQTIGGVNNTLSQQAQTALEKQLTEFTADHPRIEELSDEIVRQINAGFDLPEAYRRAEMLNPLPAAPVIAEPQTLATDPAPQTRKGSLTTQGAPNAGSNPGKRGSSTSIRDAIRNARAAIG
ncbi:hypothetical protein EN866_32995 [Mesorhizobium sp. M2D.F.Ca.ET.223.01.1.1]|uniref:hypothetical protein n=1 Tax=Mesorhizobium sp. M2D.F.Ca.ET.223.01.1.1 TaxID=2563940 RepID=UPI0010927C00|nr:hypothetical protein [Mesorhizobium sp. M2D.F.Ca.ET.223.01.1.1]TGR84569.1 hypothetical protein EN866_32995 [Mesorhizobium sp. M2D.F.Ca.ET.223.01.1.1]